MKQGATDRHKSSLYNPDLKSDIIKQFFLSFNFGFHWCETNQQKCWMGFCLILQLPAGGEPSAEQKFTGLTSGNNLTGHL